MIASRTSLAGLLGALAFLLFTIGRAPHWAIREEGEVPLPAHLAHLPGILYMRSGTGFVPAPQELVQLAQSYPAFPNKGPLRGGVRLTILADKTNVGVGETVRVIHCHEVLTPGKFLYVMGPKPVFDEFVNGRNMCPSPPPRLQAYNGMVVPTPDIDFNYDPTNYTFQTPGVYRIWWGCVPDSLGNSSEPCSNVVIIRVRAQLPP